MTRLRLAAGLAITALIATLTVLVGTSPAHAATEIDSRVVIKLGAKRALYNKTVPIQVVAQGYNPVDQAWQNIPAGVGTLSLQRRLNGSKVWKTVQTSTSSRVFSVKAQGNAVYRAVYSGGDYTSQDITFKPSTSKTTKFLKTARVIKAKITKRLVIKGRVTPKYQRKVVVIERKLCTSGCKWKRWNKVRTNKRGVFQFKAPAPPRIGDSWYYRVSTPKKKLFIKSRGDKYFRTFKRYV